PRWGPSRRGSHRRGPGGRRRGGSRSRPRKPSGFRSGGPTSSVFSNPQKDHPAFDLDVVHGNRLGGWEGVGLPSAEVEGASMAGALHFQAEHVAFRQRRLGVAAAVTDRVDLAFDPEESDAVLADVDSQPAAVWNPLGLHDLDP